MLKTKHGIEHHQGEFCLGLVLTDQLLFSLAFQRGDLELEPTPKQKLMILDKAPKVLLRTSRNVAKSVSIRGRIMRDIATHRIPKYSDRWDEILVVAPSQATLMPLVDKLFSDLFTNPAFRLMISTSTKGDAPVIETRDRLKIFFRIEGLGDVTGRTQVAVHPRKIYLDEAAYGSTVSHKFRLDGAQPDATWLYAGVPNDVRTSPFYELSATPKGSAWSQHNLQLLKDNPLFSRAPMRRRRKFKRDKIKEHGGEHSPSFITQVLGHWGDEAASSFPAGSVSWDYDNNIFKASIVGSDLEIAIRQRVLASRLPIPQARPLKAVIGWDYGISPDPANMIIAIQTKEGEPWRTYARVTMWAAMPHLQITVLKYLWNTVLDNRCVWVSVDIQTVYHMLLDDHNKATFGGRCRLTNPGGTVYMDLETGGFVGEDLKESYEFAQKKKAGQIVVQGRKFFLTEMLRRYMANQIAQVEGTRLILAYDSELENELVATVERKTPTGRVVYEVPKERRVNQDQITDGIRAVVDCINEIEQFGYRKPADTSDLVRTLGWAPTQQVWQPPWQ